jgi:hypothetical protein
LPSAPAIDPIMAERIPESLQQKISERLGFYEDIGINLFYRDRVGGSQLPSMVQTTPAIVEEEINLPKPVRKPEPVKMASVAPPATAKIELPRVAPGPSLFESVEKVANETLLQIREDLGECTRCKLHRTRNKIVYGDGNPKAQLVFVGEGPGHDEDIQGLPFVGRAGKLLTQMIEAMGLQRKDVYICNVVKCRPPENRQPEKD